MRMKIEYFLIMMLFIFQRIVKKVNQSKVIGLNSKSADNFKSIGIDDNYLGNNINRQITLVRLDFVEINQNTIGDTTFLSSKWILMKLDTLV